MEPHQKLKHEYRNFGHLIFDRDAEIKSRRKDSIFNKWYWVNYVSTYRRMNLELYNLAQKLMPNGMKTYT